ncbi:NUDIX hydrolase [Candidatus Micrarchaeota archaeon]|nr:NUDIX hydrolase [Candidatus Micrarchaeota archaeon]
MENLKNLLKQHLNTPERLNSGCVIFSNVSILILFRIKHQHYEFPGGGVEEGESLEEAAIRETKEELGCDVKLIKHINYYDFTHNGKKIRSHNFLARVLPGTKPFIAEPERFNKLFLMPIDEYKNHPLAPNVKQFCIDFLKGKIKF